MFKWNCRVHKKSQPLRIWSTLEELTVNCIEKELIIIHLRKV